MRDTITTGNDEERYAPLAQRQMVRDGKRTSALRSAVADPQLSARFV